MMRHDLPVRPADVVWLSLAILLSVAAILGLYAWARDAARAPFALGTLFWVFAGLALLVASAGWLIASAWRRTCWGAPRGSRREQRG